MNNFQLQQIIVHCSVAYYRRIVTLSLQHFLSILHNLRCIELKKKYVLYRRSIYLIRTISIAIQWTPALHKPPVNKYIMAEQYNATNRHLQCRIGSIFTGRHSILHAVNFRVIQ